MFDKIIFSLFQILKICNSPLHVYGPKLCHYLSVVLNIRNPGFLYTCGDLYMFTEFLNISNCKQKNMFEIHLPCIHKHFRTAWFGIIRVNGGGNRDINIAKNTWSENIFVHYTISWFYAKRSNCV